MPIYTFENTETNEVYDMLMKYDDKVKYLKKHPEIKERIGAPQIVGGHGDRVKTDGGFNDVLSNIASKHVDSPMGERYHRKSTKEVKTREVIKKHVDIQSRKK